jgi:DedD protein
MAEQQQDVDALKRRGRRRLVGAVALVLLAVIVLPMVFDAEPRRNLPPVSVRIPGENDTPFKPKPPAPKGEFVVPVGAYTNVEGVTAKLAAAKIPYYTESAQGNLTRVRAGPFATREAAEEAAAKLKAIGFEPGTVSPR